MSEPKSIEEVPSWVIVNALRCPIEAQISIVAKLLQHLDREQRDKALSMSGVVGRIEQLKSEVFTLANKLAVAWEGDAAVAMHGIHNRL